MILRVQAHNQLLYILVAILSGFIFFSALGPGLYGEPIIPRVSWQHIMFNFLCHQDIVRSFSINGTAMSVCSRCIGIYGAFVISWLLMPLIVYIVGNRSKLLLRLFSISIMLNLIDVIGNLIGFWTNTSGSRFIIGMLFGASSALLLMNEFFKRLNTEV